MCSFTLGSLFSGSGGFELAGALSGIRPVWAAEVEPYPIAVTRSRFPEMQHLGSVTEVHGDKVQPVDVITFGSPCFPAGTLVNTADGLKPIERVGVGDRVLSHTGMYRQVLNSRYTGTKPVLELKAMGITEIEATENHRFLVRTKTRIWDNVQQTNRRVFSAPQWTELKDVHRGDYLCIPVIQTQENPLELTHEECWLIGRYIADGYIRNGQRPGRPDGSTFSTVAFCIGEGKQDNFEGHLTTHKAGKSRGKNVTKYIICDSRLLRLCEMCGKGAENKVIPVALLNLPVELLASVIEGYMSGDGCCVHGRYKATTVSRALAYSLGAAVAKAYHAPYCVYRVDVPETTVIEGRTVNQKPFYQVTFKREPCKQDKAFYENGSIWVPVNSVTETGEKKAVYDLTVAADHSFCVLNVAAHNCQDLSVAGKRAGIHDGQRSNLFFEAIRIIKEMRAATNGRHPAYSVWENVPGAFSSNQGEDFRCVLEEFVRVCDGGGTVPRPDKGKWKSAGEILGDGYSIAWRQLDAQYWGVPQRRKRIYLVADFAGGRAGEILFEREGLRGHPAAGRAPGQGAAADAPGSVGRSRGIECLNPWDCQSKRIYQPDGVFPTLPAMDCGGANNQAVMYALDSMPSNSMKSSNLHSGFHEETVAKTLQAGGVDPTCNQGGNVIVEPVYALQGNGIDRADTAGCNGRGWREDVCYTLNTIDRPAICFKPGQGAKARSIGASETVSPTLGSEAGGSSVPSVCYPQVARTLTAEADASPCIDRGQNVVCYAARGNGDGTRCPTLTGDHENRVTDYTAVTVYRSPKIGEYAADGTASTMAARDFKSPRDLVVEHPPAYGVDCRNAVLDEEKTHTLQAKANGGQSLNCTPSVLASGKPPRKYIIRRLTPLECCRLQGFPDGWGVPAHKDKLSDEELAFWQQVRDTSASIAGKQPKKYSAEALTKWYNALHTDSAEYKMWGNGIALPCAAFVLEGIAEALMEEKS